MSEPRPYERSFATNSNGIWPEFYMHCYTKGYKHTIQRNNVPAAALDINSAYATEQDKSESSIKAMWVYNSGALLIGYNAAYQTAQYYVFANSTAEAEAILGKGYKLCPEVENNNEDEITCWFWRNGPQGPKKSNRNLDALRWKDIKDNYPHAEGLDHLMTDFTPGLGGQLILWQGGVGLGKTSALRALACEWREGFQLHYIVDPEAFFGSSADYMMDVLMEFGANTAGLPWDNDDYDYGYKPSSRTKDLWRLVVLEDCGEMLKPDAKENIGQALSRLLNVCDGLIGRGLKFLVLVTTNEEIGKLHEAVARPGRCAARVEFKPFAVDEANRWLESHGYEGGVTTRKSLADLYGMVNNFDNQSQDMAMGFR